MYVREQERKKERCEMKVGVIVTSVLLGCVLALLACVLAMRVMAYTGSAAFLSKVSMDTGLASSDDLWQTHLKDFKSSETSHPPPVTEGNADKQENVNNMRQLNDLGIRSIQQLQDANMKQKTHKELFADQQHAGAAAPQHVKSRLKYTSDREVRNIQHPQASTDTERLARSSHADLRDAGEDANNIGARDANVGEARDESEQPGEESRKKQPEDLQQPEEESRDEELEDLQGFGMEIDVTSGTTSSVADQIRALPPLPFMKMSWPGDANLQEVKTRPWKGVFWACFPASALEWHVKKYTPVFNKVARSQKWRIYPYLYLDTTNLNDVREHVGELCSDVEKITFVLEKATQSSSGTRSESVPTSLAWFRRVFEAGEEINTRLVVDFLKDVHAGKLPAVISPKGDL